MAAKDGVSLVRVGDAIVVMIEMFPTAFMLALDVNQALRLSESLEEMAMRGDTGGEGIGADMLAALLKGKKPTEPQ